MPLTGKGSQNQQLIYYCLVIEVSIELGDLNSYRINYNPGCVTPSKGNVVHQEMFSRPASHELLQDI